MSGLACATCHRFFRVIKTGVFFEEGMPVAEPGLGDDGRSKTGWVPYKLWAADLAECPECGARVLFTSQGQHPVAEHYQREYAATVDRCEPLFRVDDNGGKRP